MNWKASFHWKLSHETKIENFSLTDWLYWVRASKYITPLVRHQPFLDIPADINQVRTLVTSELHYLVMYFGSSYNMPAEVMWCSICQSGYSLNWICVTVQGKVLSYNSLVWNPGNILFFSEYSDYFYLFLTKHPYLLCIGNHGNKKEILCNLPVT